LRLRRCEGRTGEGARPGHPRLTDLVAVEQATIDLVYQLPEAELHDLQERIESRKGLHQLEYMKTLEMGNPNYRIVTI
jgi:hypothetical protein